MGKEFKIKSLPVFITIFMFILISNPLIKLFLTLIYIIYTRFTGANIKVLPNIILLFSVVIIQILTPNGLILFSIGGLSVTKGALLLGLSKSSLLIGLLYLSKLMSFTKIKFKGAFGIIIRDTFYYFNQLTSGDRVIFKSFLKQIDEKLLNLKPYDQNIYTQNVKETENNSILPFIITLILFAIDKYYINF